MLTKEILEHWEEKIPDELFRFWHNIDRQTIAAVAETNMDNQQTSDVIVYTSCDVKTGLLPSKYLQWQYVRHSYRGYVQVAFSKNKRKCVGCEIWIWMTHLTGIISYANAVWLAWPNDCCADLYSPRNQILNASSRSAEVRTLVSWNKSRTHESKVILINDGPFSGKIAVIAEIIDHNRVSATRRALLSLQLNKF